MCLSNNKTAVYNRNSIRFRLPYLFVLSTTDSCNLACNYCYASAKTESQTYMPFEIMKKTIDLALSMPHNLIGIEFHGGESLLQFDIVKKAVLYGEKIARLRNKKLKFLLQTNGLLLNADIAIFVKKHKIALGISLDCPRMIHDRNRIFPDGSGSYSRIIKNINLLRKLNVKFGILSVVSNWKYINRIFNFFVNNEFDSIKLNFLFPQGRGILQKQEINEEKSAAEFMKILDKMIMLHKTQGKKIKESNLGFILENLISPNNENRYMCMCSPCGAMFDMVAINVDGNILPCEKMIGIHYFKKYFTIGNIKNIINLKKAMLTSKIRNELLERNVDNISDCKLCTWKRFCSGGCLIDAYLSDGNINNRGLYCGFYKIVFERMLWKTKEELTTLLKLFDLELSN